MRLKDVLFRWLIQRPVVVDLREDQALCEKYHSDALVLCMWIDAAGFLRALAVASISMGKETDAVPCDPEEISFATIADCKVLPRLRPGVEDQKKIWSIRKQITASHPVSRDLIRVRKTAFLDHYRLKDRPDIVRCHAETEEGSDVLVHADGFNGTQLLGTVVEADDEGILHKGDQVMIYVHNGMHFLDPILIATTSRYE